MKQKQPLEDLVDQQRERVNSGDNPRFCVKFPIETFTNI